MVDRLVWFVATCTLGATLMMWDGFMAHEPIPNPDAMCPTVQVRIRYSEAFADYHDGPPGMKHYRIAYCKPTGIDWRR